MKTARHRMAFVATFCMLIAGVAFGSRSLRAATEEPELILPCEEEVVYGKIVVLDEENGVFGLEGKEYEFVADEPQVVRELDGLQVRMEVAVDCSIRELHILGESDALTMGPAGIAALS